MPSSSPLFVSRRTLLSLGSVLLVSTTGALGNRDAAHTLYNFGMWDNASESEKDVAWTRQLMDAMQLFTTPGVSLNFTSFRLNQNIRPSPG